MWNEFTRMNSTRSLTPLYTTKIPRSKNTWNFCFNHVYETSRWSSKIEKIYVCWLDSNTHDIHLTPSYSEDRKSKKMYTVDICSFNDLCLEYLMEELFVDDDFSESRYTYSGSRRQLWKLFSLELFSKRHSCLRLSDRTIWKIKRNFVKMIATNWNFHLQTNKQTRS